MLPYIVWCIFWFYMSTDGGMGGGWGCVGGCYVCGCVYYVCMYCFFMCLYLLVILHLFRCILFYCIHLCHMGGVVVVCDGGVSEIGV